MRKCGAALGIALGLLFGHAVTGHHAAGGSSAAVTDAVAGVPEAVPGARTAAPDGSSYTPASWAKALLSYGGWPESSCNLAAIRAWENAEGGQWGPNPNDDGNYNPLNATIREPGSSDTIYTGTSGIYVQAYPSWRSGFQATVATLDNGYYPSILGALRAADSAQAVVLAVTASPWGTGQFGASC
jgi:hypothetical protein